MSEEGVEFRSNVDGKKIFLSPEKAMQVQASLGSDMVSIPFPPLETGTSFSRTRHVGSNPPPLMWNERTKLLSTHTETFD